MNIKWSKVNKDGFTVAYVEGREVAELGRYDWGGKANHYCASFRFEGGHACVEMYFVLHDADWESNSMQNVQPGFKTAHAARAAAMRYMQQVIIGQVT